MPVDLGVDDDVDAIKALSGTDTTWSAKVANVCRRLFHSDSNGFGPAATLAAIDATAGVPVGTLADYISTSVPAGYVEADGRSLSRTTYAALFAVCGTAFGSDSASTFNVPDMRRRQSIGRSSGHAAGSASGSEIALLSADNLPAHSHDAASLSVADAGEHGHESGGGYGASERFGIVANQTYTAAPSASLQSGGGVRVEGIETAGLYVGQTLCDADGAHTHAATGMTDAAGGSANISIVSPSITMVKCVYHGVT